MTVSLAPRYDCVGTPMSRHMHATERVISAEKVVEVGSQQLVIVRASPASLASGQRSRSRLGPFAVTCVAVRVCEPVYLYMRERAPVDTWSMKKAPF